MTDRLFPGTHVFQNVRQPPHPEINAVCAVCGLALPRGPILAIGPNSLPPCEPA